MTEKFLIVCNACGYQFGRSKSGTFTETKCPRCKSKVEYSVTGNKITTVIQEDKKKE